MRVLDVLHHEIVRVAITFVFGIILEIGGYLLVFGHRGVGYFAFGFTQVQFWLKLHGGSGDLGTHGRAGKLPFGHRKLDLTE